MPSRHILLLSTSHRASAAAAHGFLPPYPRYCCQRSPPADTADLQAASRHRPSASDFEVVASIGQGHFGCVEVVRQRSTRAVFAMKTLDKAETLRQQAACYREERDIMATATSPWITGAASRACRLQCAFPPSPYTACSCWPCPYTACSPCPYTALHPLPCTVLQSRTQ